MSLERRPHRIADTLTPFFKWMLVGILTVVIVTVTYQALVSWLS